MTATKNSEARLFFILARESRIGVIFRRGPSKWVQLIKWNTNTDTFELGQWFNGRIYERRCDLSPKGDKLIYFAAKFRKTKSVKHYSWTAISKPPWFTALALWPKGDCWHGGGLFEDAKNIWLNHSPTQAVLEKGFNLKKLNVRANPQAHGEDEPILWRRLQRDGWSLIQEGEFEYHGLQGGWTAKIPETWEKVEPRNRFILRMKRVGISSDKNGEWNVLEFEVEDKMTKKKNDIGRASCADWDQRCHLVFAKSGKLFRRDFRNARETAPKEIADFNTQKPAAIESPCEARLW